MVKDRLQQLIADAKAEGWGHYIKTAADEKALLEGCYVDERMGQHVCDYFAKRLKHIKPTEWSGKPFVLEQWQRDGIIMPLFSWLTSDGRRRFNEAGIWVPKKNGKSPLGAGLLLYGADPKGDGEEGAECYSMATEREQAAISYRYAHGMVEVSEYLQSVFTPVPSKKRLVVNTTSWVQALSADSASHHGICPHFFLIDEIHAFNEEGRDRISANRFGGRVRRNPLTVVISTAGAEDASIGREEYERHRRVLDGFSEDTSLFSYIREAHKTDDWTAPETWKKANPMLGISFTEDDMRKECEKAKSSPSARNDFLRFCLNVWVGASSPWLSVERWNELEADMPSIAELKSAVCFGGLDLSERSDLTAWVKIFKCESGKHYIVPHFWLPEDGIDELERNDSAPYRNWAEHGYMTICPGASINYRMVMDRITDDAKTFRIKQIGYDRYQASMIRDELTEKHQVTPVEIPQTFQGMSEPSKEFESLIKTGMIEHDGNPILARMVSQVTTICDTNGNIRPTKRGNKKRMKIDGVVASIMALRCAMAHRVKKRSAGVMWV